MNNVTTINPAHDHEFKFGDAKYNVRRSFGLIREIEQAFGPLIPLQIRLRESEATFDELAGLHLLILKDALPDLTKEQVEEMLFTHGAVIATTQVVNLLLTLFIGDVNLARRSNGAVKENPPKAVS